MKFLTRSTLLTLIALTVFAQSCLADNPWSMTITTQQLNNFLDYKGSLLQPVCKATIAYTQTYYGVSRSATYKDLYYTNLQAIGSIEYEPLNITEGTQGQAYVQSASPTGMQQREAYAAANAVERVFLDLYSKKCPLLRVIVPRSSFDTLVNGFYANGFHQYPQIGSGQSVNATIVLLILSDPAGQSQRVMF